MHLAAARRELICKHLHERVISSDYLPFLTIVLLNSAEDLNDLSDVALVAGIPQD